MIQLGALEIWPGLLPEWARDLTQEDLVWVEKHLRLVGQSLFEQISADALRYMSIQQYGQLRQQLLGALK